MDAFPPGTNFSQIPAGIPPPDTIPDFNNATSVSWAVLLSTYLTLPIMVISVMLRLYTRLRVTRHAGIDDCLCVAAALTVTAQCGVILSLHATSDLYGRHMWDIPLAGFTEEYLRSVHVINILYLVAATLIKLCFLTLYIRLFRPNRHVIMLAWAGVVFMIVSCLIFVSVILYYVIPRPGEPGLNSVAGFTRTTNLQLQNFIQGVVSTFTDVYVLCLPVVAILNLHLSVGRKTGLVGVFLTGLLACIFSIVGIYYRHKAFASDPIDATYFGTVAHTFAVAEINLGISCTCMPVWFVLLRGVPSKMGSIWKSLVDYVTSNSKPSQTSREGTERRGVSDFGLPQVPNPTLSKLKSFIRSGSMNSTTQGSTQASTYYELRSVDSTYNGYVGARSK